MCSSFSTCFGFDCAPVIGEKNAKDLVLVFEKYEKTDEKTEGTIMNNWNSVTSYFCFALIPF